MCPLAKTQYGWCKQRKGKGKNPFPLCCCGSICCVGSCSCYDFPHFLKAVLCSVVLLCFGVRVDVCRCSSPSPTHPSDHPQRLPLSEVEGGTAKGRMVWVGGGENTTNVHAPCGQRTSKHNVGEPGRTRNNPYSCCACDVTLHRGSTFLLDFITPPSPPFHTLFYFSCFSCFSCLLLLVSFGFVWNRTTRF